MDRCTFRDALDPLNRDGIANPGTNLKADESQEEAWWLGSNCDELLLVRASMLTLPLDRAAPLKRACDDMEADVCEQFGLNRTCDFDEEGSPPWATGNILRRRIVEQECYACPCNIISINGQSVNLMLDAMPG
jgi:hypothetical protein